MARRLDYTVVAGERRDRDRPIGPYFMRSDRCILDCQ